LCRFITPIGFGDKAIKLKRCSVFDQPFFEKGCDHAVALLFDQTFSQKVCAQAFFEKACITPFSVFDQTFFEKVCGQARKE
jgi:hypothetical protein